MGAAGLVEIKRRIKSINNTKKITKALGLVSTSKLRKVREKLSSNNDYFKQCEDVFAEVVNSYEEENIYTKSNKSSKKLYIVLTSDMGLCGSFNSSMISHVAEITRNDRENALILMVGEKGRSFAKRYKLETMAEYVEVGDLPTTKEASTVYNDAFEMFRKGEVSEVNIVYAKFISQLKKQIEVEQLLPIDKSKFSNIESKAEFENESDILFDNVVNLYFTSKILNSMIHAKCSEQSYRMEAMEGATKNSDDLLEKLNLKYNRIRQSAITQEISEIVGGAEAQN
ncbi:ATP synthase F1 subunit gamma [Clostridium senegalense]|uniref:ATP synthase F1 subunit gamma n=1 Tax=Clostridium senegalense TaxID=1465809 RepID=UPI000289F233|nr:ATP synthase F1 subunit gamma [Clostridium senegalense]MBU5227429.1 F0F1 ATP synthase subunit gamma [Clostridium senegalense]